MELKEKLKRLRKEKGLTQKELGKILHVAETTVSTWERGGNRPLMDKIVTLSDLYQVPIAYFFDAPEENSIIDIPILGRIACGDPIRAEENIEDYVKEVRDNLPNGNIFCLRAKGNSMYPLIPDGALVYIREQQTVENGEVAAVLLNDESEATIKRIRYSGNSIILEPENKDYTPLIVNKSNPARIIGKVIEVKYEIF